MAREFSNIIIFTDRDKDIDFVTDKITKIVSDLENEIVDYETENKIEIIQDSINNITIIHSDYFKFEDIGTNKSNIRKIAKRLSNDAFMFSSKEELAVLEKYSFNKRIYDYIVFGDEEKLHELGYDEEYGTYMYKDIWTNHFVGRNTIADVEQLLSEAKTFFEYYEIFVEILKLYGIKYELSTYNGIGNVEAEKRVIYFK